MRKRNILFSIIVMSFLSFWLGFVSNAMALKRDADAGLHLDMLRRDLSSFTKMKPEEAKKHYEDALNDLNAFIEEYADTEEALEAKFYVGTIYMKLGNFEEAVKYFDEVLSYEDINVNFKARALYFKTKALLGKGDVVMAKEAVEKLRIIEPRAAATFGRDLSGLVRLGKQAPDFNVTDFKGNLISLSQYKGSIVIIDFWATWCDPCILEFPNVKQLYREFKDKGVKFIGINKDDNIDDLKGFVEQEHIEWPQVFEGMRWKGKISKIYNVQKIPMMFILDREGKVRHIGSDTNKITQIVTDLLSESKKIPLF